jgi:hypothetical protein
VGSWSPVIPLGVGGVLAVGFLDTLRLIVGSHSGLGVFDARTGALLERIHDEDGDYGWHQDDPPSIRYPGPEGTVLVPAAGLWGGQLDQETADGWSCRATSRGAVLTAAGGEAVTVPDTERPRACGFSPDGLVFVYATSPTVNLLRRR